MFYRKIAVLGLVLALCSCSSPETGRIHKTTRMLMGTFADVSIPESEPKPSDAVTAVFDEIKRIQDLTSFHSPSALTALNEKAGSQPVQVEPEIFQIIQWAVDTAKLTKGAYDPTIGVITRLWRFSGPEEPRVPQQSEIAAALKHVGYDKIQLNEADSTIQLEAGVVIDLGGISKGYALNRAHAVLQSLGVRSALVNLGGDILALGEKAPGKPWRIGVEDPREHGCSIAVTELKGQVIFTSGDYERFITADGKRYHHILNPATGYPAENMRSVTLVGLPNATLQPVGTGVFVMGAQKGLALLNEMKDLSALLVDGQGKIHLTTGGERIFHVKDGS